jgi:hypothetical protein
VEVGVDVSSSQWRESEKERWVSGENLSAQLQWTAGSEESDYSGARVLPLRAAVNRNLRSRNRAAQ